MCSSNPTSSVLSIKDFPLGARLYATKDTGVCTAGEPGLVVEVYELGSRPGCTVLFKSGGYDGFSIDELQSMLVPEGSLDAFASCYAFKNVQRLFNNWQAGVFCFESFRPYSDWLAAEESAQLLSLNLPGTRHGPTVRL